MTDRSVQDGWRVVTLGDVSLDMGDGGTPRREVKEYFGGNIPWVVVRDVKPKIRKTTDTLTEAGLRSSSAKLWPAGTLILTTGASIGNVGIAEVPLSTKQGITGIVCDPKQLHPPFLFHVLETWKPLLNKLAQGSTFKEIRVPTLSKLSILLPTLSEQKAIATILDSIDNAVEQTAKAISATEELRKALLHELLTRGVPGWHKEWKDVPGIGTIPADWKVFKLGELAAAITSGSRAWAEHYSARGALFVRSQNIRAGVVGSTDALFVTPPVDREAQRTRIAPDDLLISITGEPGHAATADRSLGEAYVSQHVALIRLRTPALSAFVSLFLNCPSGQLQFHGMRYGQTRPGLNLENLANLAVAFPPKAESQFIAALAHSVRQFSATEEAVLDRLQDVKAATSEGLLSGHICLPRGQKEVA